MSTATQTEQMKPVKKMQVVKKTSPAAERPVVNVAAYCRVSTDMEIQKTSLETQMDSYKQIISEHPGWRLAGIYADRGLTGTTMSNRTEFLRMIEDAKAGKIDYILAKSVSRVARNTVDLLETVRTLKSYGCSILFEKERVDTSSLSSEMLLTIYAALSQEESRSFSENMKRGIRQRFEMGIPKWTDMYGFQRVKRNEWEVCEEEAKVVRKIFDMYIHGSKMTEICKYLKESDIRTSKKKGEKWDSCTISQLIKNEKYVGDYLMQKTYAENHLNHKKVINKDGVVPQYLVKDHHDAIVSRDVFIAANTIASMRDVKRGVEQYPFYGFLRCPECGELMLKIRTSSKNGTAWVCGGKGEAGYIKDRTNCRLFIIRDSYLHAPILEAIQNLNPKGKEAGFAKDIREVKKLSKDKKLVEYYYLFKLVDKITFTAWNEMEITWKNGKVTRQPLGEFEAFSEMPWIEHTVENGDNYFNGRYMPKSGLPAFLRSVEAIETAAKETFVTPAKPDAVSQVPAVENYRTKREAEKAAQREEERKESELAYENNKTSEQTGEAQ